ncbi:MAG: hypothetical protein LBI33_07795 [Propionibacteriaceae bacterium]|jgi:hypothetical protein|nr:hypothetical protein [Propionibacteriaceae bacterium]
MSTTDLEYRREFARAVSGRQAIATQEQKYYVAITDDSIRGVELHRRLLDRIQLGFGDTVTLVTGPRGSGKTSEFLRLGQNLETTGRRVLYADVTDFLRPTDAPDAGAFLTAVVAGLIQALTSGDTRSRTPRLPSRPLLDRLKSIFDRIGVDGFDVSAGIGFPPVQASVTAHISLRDQLRDQPGFRSALQNAMERNRAQFRQEMHGLVGDLSQDLAGPDGQPPVFVVDSADHIRGNEDPNSPNSYQRVRSAVEQLFSEYGDELTLPGLQTIYCAPSYVHCQWATAMPILNIKVVTEVGNDYEPGLKQLQRIIAKRAPAHDAQRLFGDEQRLTRVLRASGGLFRDLFGILENVIANASDLPASDRAINQALAERRRALLGGPNGVNREQVELLADIADNTHFRPRQAEQADFEFLEAIGAILQYPDGPEGFWLGVHPLLRETVAAVRDHPTD